MRLFLQLSGLYLLLCLSFASGHSEPGSAAPASAPPPSGLRTDDSYSVEELVQDVFVTGACNTITNIRGIGDPKGIGYFDRGASSIGMDRGVIISTGPVSNALGPNEATDKSGDFQDTSGDPDLGIMATGTVNDAVGITFDFTPLDSIVTFKYIFASEEYCEFVNSIYNDVFGFFISGPGIEGAFAGNAKNVALIPGTNDDVSINSVNHLQNSNYYIHNELRDDAILCELGLYLDNFHEQLEYDGFTKELTAVLKLQPCETYHIRLVVADVGDNFYDSAVFLAAESFNLGGEVEVSAGTGISPNAPSLEGCRDAYFLFERTSTANFNFPLTVNYTVSSVSTAQADVDYQPLSGTATIPANQFFYELPVDIFNDGIPESTEELILELDIPCACFTDTARMYIADSPPLQIELPDFAVCENGSTTISPTISSGSPGFSYRWEDGSSGPEREVSADGPSQYSVTVTDGCGNSAADSATLFLTEPPEALLQGAATICEGDTAFLPVSLSGAPPWELQYAIDGAVQPPLPGIYSMDYRLPATLPGQYELLAVSDAACEGYPAGEATLEVRKVEVELEARSVSCFGGSDGSISARILSGSPPYEFFWREISSSSLQPQGLPAGTYHLVATDSNGCSRETAIEISAPEPLSEVQPDCALLREGELKLAATGGTPPYLYSVDGQSFLGPSLFEELEAGNSYTLVVQDAAGCLFEQEFLMPNTYEAMVELPETLELKLGQRQLLEPTLHIPEALVKSLRWTPSLNLSCTDCLQPELLAVSEDTYTLRIVDAYGCTGEASVNIRIKNEVGLYLPTAFSPNGDHINDRFTVFANAYQVKQITHFAVFDRWGGLLFEKKGFPPNEEAHGWDGTSGGKRLNAGVYTYFVEVELVNGGREVTGGEVVLMR